MAGGTVQLGLGGFTGWEVKKNMAGNFFVGWPRQPGLSASELHPQSLLNVRHAQQYPLSPLTMVEHAAYQYSGPVRHVKEHIVDESAHRK